MVLRKPYALLIKYFRIIHIVLSILMIYVTLKVNSIYKLFLNYISAGWTSITYEEVSSYVNTFIYIAIILILLILIIIFLLMSFKKKQKLYYTISILVYIVLYITFFLTEKILNNAVATVIDPVNLRIYRDISLIFLIIQIILLVVPILRSIGFDVKKFNFKKDIEDLQITELDREEVEVNININKYKIRRKLNRFGRTSAYIFLRNKLVIYKALLTAIIGFLVYFSLNVFVINRIYKENSIVKLDKYSFKINKSYLTKYDSNNRIISNKYKYIVVNFTPINKMENNTFAIDKVDLKIGDTFYFPITTIYSDFKDLGYGYTNQKLATTTNLNYIMVFRLPIEQKTNRVLLRYINSTEYKDSEVIKKYKTFKLNLNDDTKNVKNINKKLNDTIDISNNIFKIINYEISNSFEYIYQNCNSNEECNETTKYINPIRSDYKVIKLNGEFKLVDKGISNFYKNYVEYFNSMIYIKYTVDNNEKTVKVDSVTPSKIISEGKELYLEIPSELEQAIKIEIHLKSRNIDYNIKIK